METSYTRVHVNVPALKEIYWNRITMGPMIERGDWDNLIEFWRRVARPALLALDKKPRTKR